MGLWGKTEQKHDNVLVGGGFCFIFDWGVLGRRRHNVPALCIHHPPHPIHIHDGTSQKTGLQSNSDWETWTRECKGLTTADWLTEKQKRLRILCFNFYYFFSMGTPQQEADRTGNATIDIGNMHIGSEEEAGIKTIRIDKLQLIFRRWLMERSMGPSFNGYLKPVAPLNNPSPYCRGDGRGRKWKLWIKVGSLDFDPFELTSWFGFCGEFQSESNSSRQPPRNGRA